MHAGGSICLKVDVTDEAPACVPAAAEEAVPAADASSVALPARWLRFQVVDTGIGVERGACGRQRRV